MIQRLILCAIISTIASYTICADKSSKPEKVLAKSKSPDDASKLASAAQLQKAKATKDEAPASPKTEAPAPSSPKTTHFTWTAADEARWQYKVREAAFPFI